MNDFLGTIILVVTIAVAAYWLGKNSMRHEIRFWKQRAFRAERLADDMGRAAMENYIDFAVCELREKR